VVRLDQVFQLSLIKLLNVQFFHDVSLSEQMTIFTCDFSKFLGLIDIYLDFLILLGYTLERYLDGLLHNQVLRATGSSSDLSLRILDIVTSNKLLDSSLLCYLFLKL
jgi:hypothetical protein